MIRKLRERIGGTWRRHAYRLEFGLAWRGKRLTAIFAAIALFVIAIAGDASGYDTTAFYWLGTAAIWGWWVSEWINFDAPNPCPGPRNFYQSPTGEVSFLVCHGCESWALNVRGEEKGQGQGVESLIARCHELADTHSRNLPGVAKELRELAEHNEKLGTLAEPMANAIDPSEIQAEVDRVVSATENVNDAINKVTEIIEGRGGRNVEAMMVVPKEDLDDFEEWRQARDRQEAANGSE